eukprot:g19050.t1
MSLTERQQWEGEAEDCRVHLEDMESLPTVGRMPKPKTRSDKAKKKDEEPGRERLKRELIEQREGLPIAPKRKMLQDPAFSDCAFSAHICSYGARVSTYCEGLLDSSNHKPAQEEQLVTWLPYDSIEVVFNDKNVWANRQNHHPACITYDLDDDDSSSEPAFGDRLIQMGPQRKGCLRSTKLFQRICREIR